MSMKDNVNNIVIVVVLSSIMYVVVLSVCI